MKILLMAIIRQRQDKVLRVRKKVAKTELYSDKNIKITRTGGNIIDNLIDKEINIESTIVIYQWY